MRTIATAVAVTALLASAPAWAQNQGQNQGQEQKIQRNLELSQADAKFVQKAMTGGMMEVQLGKMAQEKAQNQAVKDFGAKMERDHSKANEKLLSIVEPYGIEKPRTLPDPIQAKIEAVEKHAGSDAFDRAYMTMMVKAHEQDIAAFETYVDNTGTQDLKQFAEQTLPTLRAHLEKARQITGGQGMASAAGDRQQQQQQQAAAGQNWQDLVGAPVMGRTGEQIGEIEQVIVGPDGQMRQVILEHGGFLGLGDKKVAIERDRLKVDQQALSVDMTEQEIETLPAYTD